jgi:hypothetical protein
MSSKQSLLGFFAMRQPEEPVDAYSDMSILPQGSSGFFEETWVREFGFVASLNVEMRS